MAQSPELQIAGKNGITEIPETFRSQCERNVKANCEIGETNSQFPEQLILSYSNYHMMLKKNIESLLEQKIPIFEQKLKKAINIYFTRCLDEKMYGHRCRDCENACINFLDQTKRIEAIDQLLTCQKGADILQMFICFCSQLNIY